MILELFPQTEGLVRIDSPQGRTYQTPDGNIYPSVSTVIGASEDKTFLNEWRAKVGDVVADDISKRATTRGTLLHENIENFVLGKPLTFSMFHTEELSMFKSVIGYLGSLDTIYCIETQLWSDRLKIAGTVDMVAIHEHTLKVIDWKTSRRYKTKAEISGYFMQASAYAEMVNFRYGLSVGTLSIVIMTQDDGLLVYEDPTTKWLPKFIEARRNYKI